MSTELQGVDLELAEALQEADEVESPQEPQTEDATKPDEGSALATDTVEEPEKTTEPVESQTETPEETDQDRVQAAINKQHRKFREEERAHAETRRRNEELEAENARLKGTDKEPEIPPIPDPYSDNYEEQVKARDAAIEAHAEWRGAQAEKRKQAQDKAERDFIQAQTELAEKADGYAKRAEELGVNGESLQKASEVVAGYGITDELTRFFLSDPDGPLMVQYLAADIQTLSDIAKADPFESARLIETELRPKAQALRAKPSTTPKPPQTLGGGGPGESDLGSHKGVVID